MIKISIKTKLLVLVIIILIPLIALQGIRMSNEFKDRIESELDANQDFAEAIDASFTTYIEEIWIQQGIIGSYITSHPIIPLEEINAYLEGIQQGQETFLRVAWVSPEGTVLASSSNEINGKNILKQREYIQRILSGEEKVISDLEKSIVDNRPIVIVARGIKKNGQLMGIISGVIDIGRLKDRLPQSKITTKSRFGLVDRTGMIVYRSDNSDPPYERRKISDDSPAWKALKGELVRTGKRKSTLDGSIRMGVDYPIKKIGWSCFVTTSYESVMADQKTQLINDVIILIGVSLISILAAFLLGIRILKPLSHIKEAAATIKAGDFSARTNIKGYDELAVTAEAFDSMAESIERYDKARSQFFTNLSHELKTPLNVILASTQLIRKIEPSSDCCNHSKVYRQMGVIKQNSYRLIRMINNLIDVSRYEGGYLPVKLENYDIVSIIEDITMSIVRFAETKEVEIVFDTDVEEKVMAFDPDLIERIMLNLLSNALKFTNKDGSITVSLLDKTDKIVISVKDTGIGIPKDKLDVIFERFGQVESSLSRNQEGSGIGLSLVKSLVEAHHGNIKVSSVWGEGTEFMIEIPAEILPQGETITEHDKHNLIEKIAIEFSDIYELNERG